MDSIAVVPSHVQVITEDGTNVENDSIKGKVANDVSMEKRHDTLCCGCFNSGRKENINSKYELQSSPENDTARQLRIGCAREIKSFLSSPVYLIFVIVATLCIFIVLFVELLIDTEFYLAPASRSNTDAGKVSVAVHWFAFAVLAGFFIELLFRILAWSTAIFKDCISVFDGCFILIAFISNLCATIIAGPNSPFDSISLIIIFRLVRIHSLIAAKVKFKTAKLQSRIAKIEEQLLSANCTISSLHRRVEEKDYEIRQLQAHLGSEEPRRHLVQPVNGKSNRGSKQATTDTDLELAIALSKKSYEEDNGGIVNRAFVYNQIQEEKEMAVLIHKAPAGMDSIESDLTEDHKVKSYIDEYFSNPDLCDQSMVSKSSTGAISKKRTLHLPVQANVNKSNNPQLSQPGENSLQILQVDNSNIEPISVCIDPSILVCESPVTDGTNFSTLEKNIPSQVSLHDVNSHTSDTASSDDCHQEITTDADDASRKHPRISNLPNKSGSFVSSESGYLSEGPTVKNTNGVCYK